jgi:hypothetical protein
VAAKKFEPLGINGAAPQLLKDGKRLLIAAGPTKVQIVDRTGKNLQDVLSVAAPSTVIAGLSKDNKAIFYLTSTAEADIYQLRK